MKKLLILGCGGHGQVVADAADAAGNFSDILFLDSRFADQSIAGIQCLAPNEITRLGQNEWAFIAAIGDNRKRETASAEMLGMGYSMVNIVHPWSYVSKRAAIKNGSMILAGAVVQTTAVIGRGAIVNNNATIEHDCMLGDFSHIASGVSLGGNVSVGARALIGTGASILRGLKITADVIVGAGAVVTNDIREAGTYAGVPARRI